MYRFLLEIMIYKKIRSMRLVRLEVCGGRFSLSKVILMRTGLVLYDAAWEKREQVCGHMRLVDCMWLQKTSCTTYSVSTGAAAVSCEWLLLPTIFSLSNKTKKAKFQTIFRIWSWSWWPEASTLLHFSSSVPGDEKKGCMPLLSGHWHFSHLIKDWIILKNNQAQQWKTRV